MNDRPGSPVLFFAIVMAIVAISTASIFVRFAQHEAPSLVIAALRLGIATIVIAPLAIFRYRGELQKLTRRELSLAGFSGVFLALHFAAWITSLEYTSVINSVVLVATAPLWVALLSPILIKESLTSTIVSGLVLTLLGVIVIALGDVCQFDKGLTCPSFPGMLGEETMLGNLLALSSAWALAGYLIIGRSLRSRMTLVPYVFVVYGVAAVLLVVAMLAAGQRPTGFSPITYLWIALLALVPQLVGHSTFNWVLRFIPATLVAILTLGEPIGSAVLAYFFLQETPAPLVISGGFVILIGIYISSKNDRR